MNIKLPRIVWLGLTVTGFGAVGMAIIKGIPFGFSLLMRAI